MIYEEQITQWATTLKNIKEHSGEVFRNIRKKYNLTQQEFAKELGISSKFLNHIESGTFAPDDNLIQLLAFWVKVKNEL
jgi:transcriptional regulator with XRE-family HTH domain